MSSGTGDVTIIPKMVSSDTGDVTMISKKSLGTGDVRTVPTRVSSHSLLLLQLCLCCCHYQNFVNKILYFIAGLQCVAIYHEHICRVVF